MIDGDSGHIGIDMPDALNDCATKRRIVMNFGQTSTTGHNGRATVGFGGVCQSLSKCKGGASIPDHPTTLRIPEDLRPACQAERPQVRDAVCPGQSMDDTNQRQSYGMNSVTSLSCWSPVNRKVQILIV